LPALLLSHLGLSEKLGELHFHLALEGPARGAASETQDPGQQSPEAQQHLLLPARKWLCSLTWLILNETNNSHFQLPCKNLTKLGN
jgi:hypothetical protein